MGSEGKQMVCIHCRQPERIEPVAITERGQEVGVIYCCSACRTQVEGYAMDIFLYGQDDDKPQRMLH